MRSEKVLTYSKGSFESFVLSSFLTLKQIQPNMVMFKKIKSFEVVFNDPEKVYGSGEKVAGRVIVEVCEVTRVKAVRILACGVAKVLWMQGSQQCKQTLDYLRYEDTLLLDDQPAGK